MLFPLKTTVIVFFVWLSIVPKVSASTEDAWMLASYNEPDDVIEKQIPPENNKTKKRQNARLLLNLDTNQLTSMLAIHRFQDGTLVDKTKSDLERAKAVVARALDHHPDALLHASALAKELTILRTLIHGPVEKPRLDGAKKSSKKSSIQRSEHDPSMVQVI